MGYLLLYGNGWTQRWSVAAEREDEVRSMLVAVGSSRTDQLPVLDPGSDAPVTLFVSWSKVAAAIMLDADMPGTMDDARAGQYQ